MAIDWTYLNAIGGEGLENFVATCLRQRYADARQTRAASGDCGIDIYRETPDGLVVWQVKRYTAPITPDQKQKIKRSWQRFWDTHVQAGKKICDYSLVTPWTPTEGHLEWFLGELCAQATFPTSWEAQPSSTAWLPISQPRSIASPKVRTCSTIGSPRRPS